MGEICLRLLIELVEKASGTALFQNHLVRLALVAARCGGIEADEFRRVMPLRSDIVVGRAGSDDPRAGAISHRSHAPAEPTVPRAVDFSLTNCRLLATCLDGPRECNR